MPAHLENSAVATGLEKVHFHSNPKERQCQRMFKLLYNCSHFIFQRDYAQNPSSQASAVCDPRTSRCTSWIQKWQGNQRKIANIRWIIEKAREFQKIYFFCLIDYAKAFDFVDHNKLWNIPIQRKHGSFRKTSLSVSSTALKPLTMRMMTRKALREMGIPNHLTYLLRNLCAGQEAVVRTLYGASDWFKIEKGAQQGRVLSPLLFYLYAEHIMRNARLGELQAGINMGRRKILNLRYADD